MQVRETRCRYTCQLQCICRVGGGNGGGPRSTRASLSFGPWAQNNENDHFVGHLAFFQRPAAPINHSSGRIAAETRLSNPATTDCILFLFHARPVFFSVRSLCFDILPSNNAFKPIPRALSQSCHADNPKSPRGLLVNVFGSRLLDECRAR